jgi:hypothetical protein
MKTDGPSNDLDREATNPPGGMAIRDESQPTGRFAFAVFVVPRSSAPERLLPG